MEIVDTPKSGDAKEMLFSFLQLNRAALLWKTEDASDRTARQAPFASDLNIVGVLAHLALVETSWFVELFGGRDIDYEAEFGYDFDSDVDAEWHLDGTETLAAARTMYASAVEGANKVISRSNLDDLSINKERGEHFPLCGSFST